jgi:competence protein ComEC
MHLAILTGVIAFFLKNPLGLKPAAVLGSVFIVLYVYLVGNVPSLTRSALMYLLGTLAILKRLPKQPASLLGMTFLIQMLIQPESGYSISFMLSYLALGGLLFIGEPIHTLIQGMVPEILAQPLSASMGAFMGTSAVVAWFFETIRPVGIVAGLIIVPLTAFFMIGAMAFLGLNLLLPWLVRPLGIILTIVYDVLESVTSLSALAPGITMNPFVILAASLGIWGLFVFCNQRQHLWRKQLAPFD